MDRMYDQKFVKWCAAILTILYLVLLPALGWIALFWYAAADANTVVDFCIMFTWFWIPLSIPAALYFMWSSYFRDDYKKCMFFCGMPFLTFGAFIFANAVIHYIFR